ncbi:MAG: dual specificity protein phosphatase family protein [Actinomycetota bacterium]|nr:dual specificity protein phosphatase family protein [Actinomycetota bacterium]
MSAYWVERGRLLAGPYPDARLDQLRAAGVDFILDLTEEDEPLERYDGVLPGSVRRRRMPVRDFSCPAEEDMTRILDAIDEALGDGHTVYVHCRGGIGRTGTVSACYLVRHGATPEEALARVQGPETDAQLALVRSWRSLR